MSSPGRHFSGQLLLPSRFSCVWLSSTPQTVADHAPLSMGLSRQEYWGGLPFPSPGNLPRPGIEPLSLKSPALAGRFFTTSAMWEAPWWTVLLSLSVMSDSLWPRGLQCAKLTCPSPTPGGCSNSCPSSWWCRPTISSSVVSFSSCLQSFPASGSFLMSEFFASGDQSMGVSA